MKLLIKFIHSLKQLKKMKKIKNKEVLQSYIFTTAKYDFNVYEKRILYRIVEILQEYMQGLKLNTKHCLVITPTNDLDFSIPLASLLTSNKDENYTRIIKALESLNKKTIRYEDDKEWELINLLERPKVVKDNHSFATFRIHPKIGEVFFDFSKGFKKYELKTAMQFESVYSMRFYELFSHQKTPINYTIDTLKEIFKIEGKYKQTRDFIKYVIEPAKKELDKCSPYTFHYEPVKEGRKITGIRFIPIYQPQFEDEELKKQKLNKQMSNRWFITKNVEDYLKYNFEFTDKELNNNLNLFEVLHNNLSENELLDFLVELKANTIASHQIGNIKGYLISALKKKSEQLFEQKINRKRID